MLSWTQKECCKIRRTRLDCPQYDHKSKVEVSPVWKRVCLYVINNAEVVTKCRQEHALNAMPMFTLIRTRTKAILSRAKSAGLSWKSSDSTRLSWILSKKKTLMKMKTRTNSEKQESESRRKEKQNLSKRVSAFLFWLLTPDS